MTLPSSSSPHFGLVLSGGGARGAYQAGVLAGIAEKAHFDFPFSVITGVSAGAINASALASSRRDFLQATQKLMEAWRQLSISRVFKTSFGSLSWSFARWLWMLGTGGFNLGVKGILNTKPLYQYLQGTLNMEGVHENIQNKRLRALGLSCTCYNTGKTITFIQGDQEVRPWERLRRHAIPTTLDQHHVMASAALPLLFPAIQIDGNYLGDGGLRQASPLAPAIHLGAQNLLTISTRHKNDAPEAQPRQFVGYPPPSQIIGMMMNGVFLDALENDAERLLRINHTLETIQSVSQEALQATHLRPIKLLILRPSKDLGKLAHGMEKELPRTLRTITQGLGSSKTQSPDFLSYLLFERPYIERLLELGHHDAHKQWEQIEPFLAPLLENTSTPPVNSPDSPKDAFSPPI